MPSVSTWATHALLKARFVVLVFWVALGIAMAFFVMRFISSTSQKFVPPPGTQAHAADAAIATYFPGRVHQALYSVFVTYEPPVNATTTDVVAVPTVKGFFAALVDRLRPLAPPNTIIADYYNLTRDNITVLAAKLVSPNQRAMILNFDAPVPFVDDAALDFGAQVQDAANSLAGPVLGNATLLAPAGLERQNLYAGVTGLPVFVRTVVETVKKDMALADAIVMPIAILVMGLAVSSLRLLILPVATIGLSLSVSFGLMYFVATHIRVSSTAPSLMMSLCTAMSIDYNLFLLSRYVEEVRAGVRGPQVVATVLATAGHTIVVSGLTLMLACLGLVAFPMNMLRSFGIGCSLSIGAAMLASLTFGPALLLTFPTFFEAAALPWSHYLPFLRRLRASRGGGAGSAGSAGRRSVSNDYVIVTAGDSGNEKQRRAAGHGGIGLNPKSAYDSTDCSASESTIGEPSVIVPTAGSPGTAPHHPRHHPGRTSAGGATSTTVTGISTSGNIAGAAGGAGAAATAKPIAMSGSGDQSQSREDRPARPSGGSAQSAEPPEASKAFLLLGRLLRFPVNLIVIVVILGGVCGFIAPVRDMRISDSFDQYLARGTTFRRDWHAFVANFNYGFTEPYTFIAAIEDPTQPDATFENSREAWETCQQIVANMVADDRLPGIALSQFTGVMMYGGTPTPFEALTECLTTLNCDPNLVALWESQVSRPDHRAALIVFTSAFAPTGNEGKELYDRLLSHISADAVAAATPAGGPRIVFHLDGVGPRAMDAIDRIYAQFPIIIGGTFAVVFLVVCVAFRTPVIPLRSVVSIAATELFVFGLAKLVYQSPGILDWLGVPAVQSAEAVTWIVPIVAFTVIVGVALDYDVFLVTRVNECYFAEGHTPRRAVQLGLWSTGRIITAAGVIMAIAFFGLMLSSTPALNVLGFYLVAAVLFDTFIVRTLLVPTMMALLGRYNWWPRRRDASGVGLHRVESARGLTASLSGANLDGADGPNSSFGMRGGAAGAAADGRSPAGVTPQSSPPRMSGRVGVGRPMPVAVPRRSTALSENSDDEPSLFTDQLVPNDTSPRPDRHGGQNPYHQQQQQGPTRGSMYGAV